MRRFFRLFFSFLLLFSFLGCKKSNEKEDEDVAVDVDLKEYVETVELPENLSIGFDPAEIESVDTASIHMASILEMTEKDRDTVIDALVNGDITDTKNYAEGPWLEAEKNGVKEYLTIYDGGKSFGIESGTNGGLIYGKWTNHIGFNYLTVISDDAGPPHITDQIAGYGLKSDYESFVDLDFVPYTDALTEVEETLDTIGFPKLAVAEAYSLDLETIREHYDLYLDAVDDYEKEYDWSKDDEAYLFIFQQTIDDIPVIDTVWMMDESMPGKNKGSSDEITYTTTSVLYSKDGIVSLSAYNLLDDVVRSGEKQPLINEATAFKTLIDSYSGIILQKETRVTSLVLHYVAILTDENNYELTPAWVFELSEANEWDDPVDGKITPYYEYSYFVVNAITGDQIEKARDEK